MPDAALKPPPDAARPRPRWQGRRRLHFVQDVATPHNNALLRELAAVPGIDLRVEYAHRCVPHYPLAAELVDEVVPAYVYGSKLPNVRMLMRAVFCPQDRWVLVAWSNPTTRALILWFWLTRRKFNCWIDVPPDTTRLRMAFRKVALFLLRKSKVQMFAVGSVGVKYLEASGFPVGRVHNLPIAVAAAPSGATAVWRGKLGVPDQAVILVTGSRLTTDKGFDVLLRALSQTQPETIERLVTVIAGHGPLENELKDLARDSGLTSDKIKFVGWLPSEDFTALVKESDIVAHPARSDSYGGASLIARAMAKPLIASRGAGAALDIIQDGVNGWFYESDDVGGLAGILDTVVTDDCLRVTAGKAMRKVSKEGSPEAAVGGLLRYAW